MEKNRIVINKDVLNWAVRESGKDEYEVLSKYPDIVNWSNKENDKLPTFKQLEKFANYLKIPFGYFFLSLPPKNFELNTNFRTINNIFPNSSKNLRDTIVSMSQNQNWLIEYRTSQGYDTLEVIKDFRNKVNDNMDYKEVAEVIVDLIDLDYTCVENIKNSGDYYSFLRDRLEELGISVFQNGIVGNNTKRKLDIKEFRAFALVDSVAPIIFINNCDSANGKVFSLVHEFVHILYEEDSILNDDSSKERFINRITAEILVSEKYIKENWSNSADVFTQIEDLSKKLNISMEVVAIKLLDMNLVTKDDYLHVKNITNINLKNKKQSGGNYNNNVNSRLSKNFKRDVVYSIESNNLSYTEGFRLLGNIKAGAYDVLKETIYGF